MKKTPTRKADALKTLCDCFDAFVWFLSYCYKIQLFGSGGGANLDLTERVTSSKAGR
ncbi:hypothetical protein [Mangrovibacterium sp.]|uniref:hypothetical protein n=1 Tax=Mangrovibacterium sp. TaxID=1961364 RepID=UPI003561DB4D